MSSKSTRLPGHQKSKLKPNEDGFSLLEVVVALAIMAVGFVTVVQLFSGGVKSMDLSDQYLRAVTLANSKLSELELTDFNVEELSGKFENADNYRWEVDISPYQSALNDEESNLQISKIALKILWEDLGQTRTVELATLQLRGYTTPIPDSALSTIFDTKASSFSLGSGQDDTTPPGPNLSGAPTRGGPPTPGGPPNICGAETPDGPPTP